MLETMGVNNHSNQCNLPKISKHGAKQIQARHLSITSRLAEGFAIVPSHRGHALSESPAKQNPFSLSRRFLICTAGLHTIPGQTSAPDHCFSDIFRFSEYNTGFFKMSQIALLKLHHVWSGTRILTRSHYQEGTRSSPKSGLCHFSAL